MEKCLLIRRGTEKLVISKSMLICRFPRSLRISIDGSGIILTSSMCWHREIISSVAVLAITIPIRKIEYGDYGVDD